jgi:dGTPase
MGSRAQGRTDPRLYIRKTIEKDRPGEYRDPTQRDCDRIVYSSHFRRLSGVTQVVAADQGHIFHNRLTHSLRVAQLARRLAQKLLKESPDKAERIGGVDVDAAEAAGLAHDLGHPPFGHIAEEVLQNLMEKETWDAFEGNPQSFRIVTTLAQRSSTIPAGLNLTRVTLNAVLKYPWPRQAAGTHSRKWGTYHTELAHFKFARELLSTADERRSVEAELTDWADDVTYAVHDVEDFYRAGLIPLDKLTESEAERERFFKAIYDDKILTKKVEDYSRTELETIFGRTMESFPLDEKYVGTPEQRSALRDFASGIIGECTNAVTLHEPNKGDEPFVSKDPIRQKQIAILKLLTWVYVIRNPALETQQAGQRRMISELFEMFYDAGRKKRSDGPNIFPFAYREQVRKAEGAPQELLRIVADLISGMTERQLGYIYHRVVGVELGSVMDYLH